jgi:hypothetical protein
VEDELIDLGPIARHKGNLRVYNFIEEIHRRFGKYRKPVLPGRLHHQPAIINGDAQTELGRDGIEPRVRFQSRIIGDRSRLFRLPLGIANPPLHQTSDSHAVPATSGGGAGELIVKL